VLIEYHRMRDYTRRWRIMRMTDGGSFLRKLAMGSHPWRVNRERRILILILNDIGVAVLLEGAVCL